MSVEDNSRNNGNSSSKIHQENGICEDLKQIETFTPEEVTNTVGVGLFQVKLVILSGFVWMARGFEIVLLRSICDLLTCKWVLKRWHAALFTTVTFSSTILGCFLYGIWSDNYGRRTALSSSLIFLFVFGAVSAGLPNFTWFVIFRAIAGFAIGGLSQSLVLCCEYMPGSQRGRAVYILSCFWALGVVVMLSIQYSIIDTIGSWRIFVTVGTFPAFLAMVMMRFFPESFRFLMVGHQYLAANEIVAEMVESNRKSLPGILEVLPKHSHRGKVSELFGRKFCSSTILFCFMGVATSIMLVGLNVITPLLFIPRATQDFPPMKVNNTMNFLGDIQSPVRCISEMSMETFVFIVWTSALDFPGFIIYMLLVDVLDRKKLLCGSYLLSSIFIFLLLIRSSMGVMYAIFVYAARTLLMSQFDLLLLMIAETFPTSHRGTAVGLEAATFYLGHFVSAYVVESLVSINLMVPILLYGALAFCCSLASMCLKHETRGRELADIIIKE